MTEKEIIGGITVLIGAVIGFLYLWQIYRRRVKPHLFSWIIWGTLMFIGFAAQYAEKAGSGAWSLGFSSMLAFIIAGVSFFYGEKHITKGDWAAFIIALCAIPVWVATSNPLWAVIIVSAIEIVAFYPTVRKTWIKPGEEGLILFFIGGLQALLSIGAIENMNVTTVLYPAVITVVNISFVLVMFYRRHMMKNTCSVS